MFGLLVGTGKDGRVDDTGLGLRNGGFKGDQRQDMKRGRGGTGHVRVHRDPLTHLSRSDGHGERRF